MLSYIIVYDSTYIYIYIYMHIYIYIYTLFSYSSSFIIILNDIMFLF